ncbi:Phototropin-2 [Dactylella cylindrospora]|nr:Phototropin-2 [Dactylella cylindrospora]
MVLNFFKSTSSATPSMASGTTGAAGEGRSNGVNNQATSAANLKTTSNTNPPTSPPLTPTSATPNKEPKNVTSPPPPPQNTTAEDSTTEKPSKLRSSLSSSFLSISLSGRPENTASSSSTSGKRPNIGSRAETTPNITTLNTFTSASPHGQSPLASPSATTSLKDTAATTATSLSNAVVSPQKPALTNTSTDAPTSSATDLLRMAMAQNGMLKLENEDELSGQRTPRPDFQDKRIPAILHNFPQVGLAKIATSIQRGFSSVIHTVQGQASVSTAQLANGQTVSVNEKDENPNTPKSKHKKKKRKQASPQSCHKAPQDEGDASQPTTSVIRHSQTIMSIRYHYPTSSSKSTETMTFARKASLTYKSKLTKALAGLKDTPPATPRGTASEGKTLANIDTKVVVKTSTGSQNSPVTRAPKGRITVRIIAGRNLRTTPTSPNGPKDPYVVCTFESNESISKGPQKKDDGTGKPMGIPGIRGISIPMRSRTSSSTDLQTLGKKEGGFTSANWDHEAMFDVVQEHSEIVIAIYDRENQETFIGMVRVSPSLKEEGTVVDEWFPLQPRSEKERSAVTGEIQVQITFEKTAKRHFGPHDFQMLRLIGRGTFGQVYQVRKKDTNRIYAMKVLSKKVIVQKKEVAHTIGERNILVRTAMTDSPFIVSLKFSFQTPSDLYLVTDYMSGGELFWHLQQEGRFSEERAKFYIAELILALEHLHNHDIVYRDLKPENILLDANGHIALCDFGLSKSNLTKNETTNTFCGTTEYLAPEVLLDENGYTKMVDFWSLGVLVFEMCCGWSPFFAEDTQQMYKNIAFGKVRFPKDALSLEGRNFVKGLLNRNPKHRLGAQRDALELKEHAFFSDVDWEALKQKKSIPPFKPKLKSETDTSNFDTEFTDAPVPGSVRNDFVASTPLSPGMQANFRGFTFVDEKSLEEHFGGRSFQSNNGHGDRMEEDSDDDSDDAWGETHYGGKGGAPGRTGVAGKNGDDESMFNTGNFDI